MIWTVILSTHAVNSMSAGSDALTSSTSPLNMQTVFILFEPSRARYDSGLPSLLAKVCDHLQNATIGRLAFGQTDTPFWDAWNMQPWCEAKLKSNGEADCMSSAYTYAVLLRNIVASMPTTLYANTQPCP